ncbi:YhdH/YhfP family quinone oxidoreductase [Pelagibaculum spongiae]|uniref:Oxidoreductase n=1 Tax=Pelagibaculum spongiae TaxID=2080658 RepID=A0A2V1H2N5_9GAMM|nr:YhdH/YhfP family quinone oxidoreductase [Pelagibaculum spongiae]PVZ69557.1 oxidoreductase [Pelagibaculum spongiae]
MNSFQAVRVTSDDQGNFEQQIVSREIDQLPEGELLVRVGWSSLNFKDALSGLGIPGVTRNYPHTPGIDAAGEVVSDSTGKFKAGDQVIVTGYDLGMNTDGGLSQMIRVPASWATPLPQGLSTRQAMVLGTAGLTAGLSVEKLLAHGIQSGRILVTGATGGVGSIAVAILAKLGFQVIAVTGKAESEAYLKSIGASEVISRQEISELPGKPLLKPQWDGAVDCAGGQTLTAILRSLAPGGAVSCCGLVDSPKLEMTVLPFILRGVSLLGVDSVEIPLAAKATVWQKFASEWMLPGLNDLADEMPLTEVPAIFNDILKGKLKKRKLVRID